MSGKAALDSRNGDCPPCSPGLEETLGGGDDVTTPCRQGDRRVSLKLAAWKE